jgi:hypothetical protein
MLVKDKISGIDRFEYKIAYISSHMSHDDILKVISDYEKHNSRERVMYSLGAFFQKESLQLIFDKLGAGEEYKAVYLKLNIQHMQDGSIAKYGVAHPLQSKAGKDKAKKTCVENFGVENPMQNSDIQKKAEDTMIEKYGVAHALQSDDIKDKTKQTCLDRYGVENPMQNADIQQKADDAMIGKYGVRKPLQNIDSREKMQQTMVDRYGARFTGLSDDLMQR